MSAEAVFFIDEKGVNSSAEEAAINGVIAEGAVAGGMISDDQLVYASVVGEKTTVWKLDIRDGKREVLFLLRDEVERFFPSPAGERLVLTAEGNVYGWSGGALQKLSKGSEVQWSPNGSSVMIRKGNTMLVSDISKDGAFSEPQIIADGVGGPMAFVSEVSVLFQKTLPALEEEEGSEPRDVFTIATFQGETTDEYDAMLPANVKVLDQEGVNLLIFNPETKEVVVLSLETKEFILTLNHVKEAHFSTDGEVVEYIKGGKLYQMSLSSGLEKKLSDSATHLISTP